jgi:thiol:disulfide interchange protein
MSRGILLFAAAAAAVSAGACSRSDAGVTGVESHATAPVERPASIVVRVHAADGALPALLATHAARAADAHLDLYLQYSAEWCPPCRAFEKYIDDPAVARARAGTYLLIADYDDFERDATAMGVTGIPTWIDLDGSGAPTGHRITSGAWEEDIPANMAPVLDRFFHADAR